jgi:hypothetical protein
VAIVCYGARKLQISKTGIAAMRIFIYNQTFWIFLKTPSFTKHPWANSAVKPLGSCVGAWFFVPHNRRSLDFEQSGPQRSLNMR